MTNWSTIETDIISGSAPSLPIAVADKGGSISEVIERIIYTRLVGAVCLLGIVGNLLNLLVLTRKSLTYTMERMEKSAHCGLIGLAVSDMLVCVAVLPRSVYGPDSFGDGQFSFRFLYMVYGEAVISTFVLSSTWLTVTMATGRYLAVCHPLHARQFIGKRFAVWSLLIVCGPYSSYSSSVRSSTFRATSNSRFKPCRVRRHFRHYRHRKSTRNRSLTSHIRHRRRQHLHRQTNHRLHKRLR